MGYRNSYLPSYLQGVLQNKVRQRPKRDGTQDLFTISLKIMVVFLRRLNMKLFFEPQAVALIGASATPNRPGNNLLSNLETCFGENFYPINPRVDSIGAKKSYSSILDVPVPIDLAVIFIQAAGVPDAIEQCAQKGIRHVIIESGGFAETGALGTELQERCLTIAQKNSMRLWGPNCMGAINVRQMKVMSFLKPTLWHERFIPGNVSLVVQSGMLSAGFLTSILLRRPFGLSKISSIGNKMDVDEIDVLKYLIEDPETKTIAMYLESINNGREFYQLARSTTKPIIVLKSGRTAPGTRAASSHTAALAQNDRILDGAFKQAGIVRVRGMTELIEVARSFGVSEHQVAKRPKVAILTFSGGAGVVSADDIDDLGMELAPLQPQTLARLEEVFPAWMAPSNPVDLYPAIEKNGPEIAWNKALEAVITDPQVDGIIAHLFALPELQGLFDIELAGDLIKKHNKQLVVWVMGSREQSDAVIRQLSSNGIPAVTDLDSAARLLKAITMRK